MVNVNAVSIPNIMTMQYTTRQQRHLNLMDKKRNI
jgi:hypothetical protein